MLAGMAPVAMTGRATPPGERIHPPAASLGLDRLYDGIITETETFRQIVQRLPARVRTVTALQRA